MKTKGSYLKIILLILSGVFIGLCNGLFGGGGGLLCVPILKKISNLDNQKAHSTTVFIMFFLSLFSAIIYSFRITVDWFMVLFVIFGFVFGGILGVNILSKSKEKYIDIIFAILIIFSGIKMVIK